MSFFFILVFMVVVLYIILPMQNLALLQGNLKRFTFLYRTTLGLCIILVPVLVAAFCKHYLV